LRDSRDVDDLYKKKRKKYILKTPAEISIYIPPSFYSPFCHSCDHAGLYNRIHARRRPRFGAAKIRKDEKKKKAANKREGSADGGLYIKYKSENKKKGIIYIECAGRRRKDLVCVEQKEKQPT
jgi:hypothetical protein